GVAMVELRAVRHRYAGRVVLDFDQFALPQAAAVAVVGHNGSGKSTLLRLLALLERPTEGSVLWNGTVVPRRPAASLRRRVTLVEQRPVLLHGTVRDNLVYGLEIRGFGRSAVNGIIGDVVDRLGLGPLLGRRRHELSEGEIQRVAVARALALRTDVLLLDEPASSADTAAAGALYRALAAERAARPFAVCIVSHQLEDAYRWADDIRALPDGRSRAGSRAHARRERRLLFQGHRGSGILGDADSVSHADRRVHGNASFPGYTRVCGRDGRSQPSVQVRRDGERRVRSGARRGGRHEPAGAQG